MNFEKIAPKETNDDTLADDIREQRLIRGVPEEAERIEEYGDLAHASAAREIAGLQAEIEVVRTHLDDAETKIGELKIPVMEAVQELVVIEKDLNQASPEEDTAALFARVVELKAFIGAANDSINAIAHEAELLSIRGRALVAKKQRLDGQYAPPDTTVRQN